MLDGLRLGVRLTLKELSAVLAAADIVIAGNEREKPVSELVYNDAYINLVSARNKIDEYVEEVLKK